MSNTLLSFAAFATLLSSSLGRNISPVDSALFRIMCVESSGRKIEFHPDGLSFGYFGLTKIACDDIGEDFPPKNEYLAARRFLLKCSNRAIDLELKEARESLVYPDRSLDALLSLSCGFYHGGSQSSRESYVQKLLSVSDPNDFPLALSAFKSMLSENASHFSDVRSAQ